MNSVEKGQASEVNTLKITPEIIEKFDLTGPRYTSYPTAADWTNDIGTEQYDKHLLHLKDGGKDDGLSLYVHIPFCKSLCHYCGCNRVIRKEDPKHGDEYLTYIEKEIDLIAEKVGRHNLIAQLHWGGGTPNFLNNEQLTRLYSKIDDNFDLSQNAEISIEVDPRTLSDEKLIHIRELGFNRLSMGIQDFDPRVQKAINRIQSHDRVAEITSLCRELAFDSINFDLIYGLPLQTIDSFRQTVDTVIALSPDRIALYNFAHIPSIIPNQKLINAEELPSGDDKVQLFLQAREQFLNNDYLDIAMDHFARKHDAMAEAFQAGMLYRNFMGFTLKYTQHFLGLGPSSIGLVNGAFFQNHKSLQQYYGALEQDQLPLSRGLVLSADDLRRQWVINAFMCQLAVDKQEFKQHYGDDFSAYFNEEASHIKQCIDNGLLVDNGPCLNVTPLGNFFIRNVCMGFDAYRRKTDNGKFSRMV